VPVLAITLYSAFEDSILFLSVPSSPGTAREERNIFFITASIY
jgi:hypothetical protein